MPYRKKKYNKNMYNRNFKKRVLSIVQSTQETRQKIHSWTTEPIQDTGRTPISQSLVDISQGDTQNDRQGNQIIVTGIYSKLFINAGDGINNCRVILYIPRDADDSLSTLTPSQAIDMDKYTVLYDRIINVSTTAGDYSKPFVIARKFNKGRRKGMTVQYSSTTGTSVERNNLKLYVVGDSGAIPDPNFNGHIRVYYKDA